MLSLGEPTRSVALVSFAVVYDAKVPGVSDGGGWSVGPLFAHT